MKKALDRVVTPPLTLKEERGGSRGRHTNRQIITQVISACHADVIDPVCL